MNNVQDDVSLISNTYEMKTGLFHAHAYCVLQEREAAIALDEQDTTQFKKELWTVEMQQSTRSAACILPTWSYSLSGHLQSNS